MVPFLATLYIIIRHRGWALAPSRGGFRHSTELGSHKNRDAIYASNLTFAGLRGFFVVCFDI